MLLLKMRHCFFGAMSTGVCTIDITQTLQTHGANTGSFGFSELEGAMPAVAEQVVVDVQQCLSDHGFPRLSEDRVDLLKGQVTSVHSVDHPVHKLIRE